MPPCVSQFPTTETSCHSHARESVADRTLTTAEGRLEQAEEAEGGQDLPRDRVHLAPAPSRHPRRSRVDPRWSPGPWPWWCLAGLDPRSGPLAGCRRPGCLGRFGLPGPRLSACSPVDEMRRKKGRAWRADSSPTLLDPLFPPPRLNSPFFPPSQPRLRLPPFFLVPHRVSSR